MLHELAEAVTNPDVHESAWVTDDGSEVADLVKYYQKTKKNKTKNNNIRVANLNFKCAGMVGAFSVPGTTDGILQLPALWSNKESACVFFPQSSA